MSPLGLARTLYKVQAIASLNLAGLRGKNFVAATGGKDELATSPNLEQPQDSINMLVFWAKEIQRSRLV